MSTALLTCCPPLTMTERLLRGLASAALAAAAAWRHWHLRQDQTRQARLQVRLSEELPDALLRDIGAPAWLEADARGRRSAEAWRLQAQRLDAGRMFL